MEASVVITPTSGAPGTSVHVEAVGFPSHDLVRIGAGRVNSEFDIIGDAITSDQGRLEIQESIPRYAAPGEEWVIVVLTPDYRIKIVSNRFAVTADEVGASEK
jgi:hypothetical protein